MRIAPYAPTDFDRWDQFVAASLNGTFLHSRRFLSYHGARFRDASLLVWDDRDRLLGVLPAAINPHDPAEVVSHPGATYGGIVRAASLGGGDMTRALRAIAAFYREHGLKRLTYKTIPSIYHLHPCDDDIHALFQLGGVKIRCDLSAAIDLQRGAELSRRRKRACNKAQRRRIEIRRCPSDLGSFWDVLEANLHVRYAASPVHTMAEMTELFARFPDHIQLATGRLGDDVVAGTVLFCTQQTIHTQYLASTPDGREAGALDYVLESCIRAAVDKGKRFFNFGVSNDRRGTLQDGLYQFKAEFGAGGVVHDVYELALADG